MIGNTKTMSAAVRKIEAKVELFKGFTLVDSFYSTDAIKSIKIERTGEESKFFGFGVCQKLNLHLIDIERKINISTANSFNVYFNAGSGYEKTTPTFFVTEVNRDENTNELSITAYDIIYQANQFTVENLGLISYTINDFVSAIAAFANCAPVQFKNITDNCFDTFYEEGANFDGSETLRQALDAAAEASQTIYYIDANNRLVFKRFDINGEPELTISKEDYFELDSSTNKRLATIMHTTELGDNVSASLTVNGSTQFVRNNPFWELREDIGALVDNALAAIGGLTINQHNCNWRGNYLLEIGDKIGFETKDNGIAISYIINDSIEYNGALSEQTSWSFTDNSNENASNPTKLGEALSATFARVDKANKEIELLASDVGANRSALTSLRLDTDSIIASVEKVEQQAADANDGLTTLREEVSTKMDSSSVQIAIQKELENGTSKVVTKTGFTFDDDGLTVEKNNSEMKTQITEDGMKVYKNNEEVLTANNVGVNAKNLHAVTYLIIGNNSRFEDYGNGRTGCFWIGGGVS